VCYSSADTATSVMPFLLSHVNVHVLFAETVWTKRSG